MLQSIKMAHDFDSEGCNLRDSDQDDRQLGFSDLYDRHT